MAQGTMWRKVDFVLEEGRKAMVCGIESEEVDKRWSRIEPVPSILSSSSIYMHCEDGRRQRWSRRRRRSYLSSSLSLAPSLHTRKLLSSTSCTSSINLHITLTSSSLLHNSISMLNFHSSHSITAVNLSKSIDKSSAPAIPGRFQV
jgi:hypothetical protein